MICHCVAVAYNLSTTTVMNEMSLLRIYGMIVMAKVSSEKCPDKPHRNVLAFKIWLIIKMYCTHIVTKHCLTPIPVIYIQFCLIFRGQEVLFSSNITVVKHCVLIYCLIHCLSYSYCLFYCFGYSLRLLSEATQ